MAIDLTCEAPVSPCYDLLAETLRSVARLRSHVLTAAVLPAALTTRIDATAAMKLFARSVEASTPAR